MKKSKENRKIILGFIIGIMVSSVTAYFTTTQDLTANGYPIHSENVGYTDSFNLGATNVQAAINGTCTKFNTQLTSLKSDIIDTIYPVGSIYVSETDSSVTAVQNRFKTFGKITTWVAYGSGKTLVGAGIGTDANGNTQTFSVSNNSKNLGEYTHKLTVTEIPSHTHTLNFYYAEANGGGLAKGIPFNQISTNRTGSDESPVNSTGGNGFHNNISPYITVYIYKRTA